MNPDIELPSAYVPDCSIGDEDEDDAIEPDHDFDNNRRTGTFETHCFPWGQSLSAY